MKRIDVGVKENQRSGSCATQCLSPNAGTVMTIHLIHRIAKFLII